jgi:hypothetical protein
LVREIKQMKRGTSYFIPMRSKWFRISECGFRNLISRK